MKAIRLCALEYLKQSRFYNPTVEDFISAFSRQGFTVLEFSHVLNTPNVEKILTALDLKEYSLTTKSFAYADEYNRLIFVLDGLSDVEKRILLSHEQGHISLNHLTIRGIYGADIIHEFQANEYASFLLSESFIKRLTLFYLINKMKIWLYSIGAIIFIIGLFVLAKFGYIHLSPAKTEFYVTTSGNKYHEEQCIFVKNRTNVIKLPLSELKVRHYERCEICLP